MRIVKDTDSVRGDRPTEFVQSSGSQGRELQSMDLFQVVVIGILALASFTVVAGFVVMLIGSARRQPARRAKVRIAPGWYPDAQDESLLRYFDGRVPTQQTSRREMS